MNLKTLALGDWLPLIGLVGSLCRSAAATGDAAGGADLWQARNGTPAAPVDPVQWVKGNAGAANSHYVEGYAVPYRVVLSGLRPGHHRLVIEWDIKQGGRHAIDYLAHFDRLQPHNQFEAHTQPETIRPLDNVPGPFGEPTTFPIPAPSAVGSPVPGQPAASFQALPAQDRVMSIWNGAITNLAYVAEGDLNAGTAATRLAIDLVATNPTVVLAWGGHIASRLDWGAGRSAADIAGSPYHMRLIELNGTGGNQDRSLQAQAVVSPPLCSLAGPDSVCPGSVSAYRASTDVTNPAPAYQWALVDNTSGAAFLGATNSALVEVQAGGSGTYTVQVTISDGGGRSTCRQTVEVKAGTTSTPLTDQTACPRSTVTFGTAPAGAGPFTFVWRKNGILLAEATNHNLVLDPVAPSDAGFYTVEVSGACSAVTQGAMLTVFAPPEVGCPPDLTVACWDEVPRPDPGAVAATAPAGGVQVAHLGDAVETNGVEYLIRRTYAATDACGSVSTCTQSIRVIDVAPPVVVCPGDLTLPCAGAPGAPASFDATASDACDGPVPVLCLPPSGSTFALGVNRVICRATDRSGNEGECAFRVTVQDLEPPQVFCPGDRVLAEDPPGSGQARVTFPAPTATDNCDNDPGVTCSVPSGASLPLGETPILCTARDTAGNTNQCRFAVKVVPQVIVATSTADSGPGTLRQALLDANAAPGSNTIAFAFSGGPPYVIHLLSPLPAIADPLTLDGWSQIEFRGAPVIELDGRETASGAAQPPPASGEVAGLVITRGHTVIRGLVLHGFAVGLRLEGDGGNVVEGNGIGADSTGVLAPGNATDGIQIASPNNRIGGPTPAAGNVIAANRGRGILLETPAATGNVVSGNFIGLARDGVTPLGNARDGVALRNGAAHNALGPDNVIAHNGGNGVLLEPSAGSGNAVRRNAIRFNAALGIDLNGDGLTANDTGDADAGPNALQNFPALTLARTEGGSVTVVGSLEAAARSSYALDFFLSDSPGGAGASQGTAFLGSTTVLTGTNGQADFQVALPVSVEPDQFITATATDPANSTSEFAPAVWVGSPPFILAHPAGTNVSPGTPVTFCVLAGGSQPLSYQWRHNGANIPDATNACHIIPAADLADGGSYSVVVANSLDAVLSDEARLTLELRPIPAGDDFADRVLLVRTNGVAGGSNAGATVESGEPTHFGKGGGKSVWYTWIAPTLGIARFRTTGSTFDTLLAVYEGASLTNLEAVASDEDRGGFFTSEVRFNAYPGIAYQIAVDGYGGQEGRFVFSWELQPTNHLLPVIVTQPSSQTVAPGAACLFSVEAVSGCVDGHHDCRHPDKDHHAHHPEDQARLTYQWYLNGHPLPGATNTTLRLEAVQGADLGQYTVEVRDGDQAVESLEASLQLNLTGWVVEPVQAADKFLDAASLGMPLRLGGATPVFGPPPPGEGTLMAAPAALARGYTGTQVFNTAGSSTELGEEPICGVTGGASQWISFVPEETGLLYLTTDGSTYNTVMAVFVRSPTNASVLQLLDCDNNGGLDGRDSALTVPVRAGQTNFIVVDGVNGATGTLQLNYSLVTPTSLVSLGKTAVGNNRLRLVGHPDMRFTIQHSSNVMDWVSLLTTNSANAVFDFVDRGSSNVPVRYYRALMRP